MVKKIASSGWRVGVSEDGKVFSIGVRAENGLEYETFFVGADSSRILTQLLARMVDVHAALPPREFAQGSGPTHPLSVPLKPLATRVEARGDMAVMELDFGGTVLKVEIDPHMLMARLSAALDEAR